MTTPTDALQKLIAALDLTSVPSEEHEAMLLDLNEIVFKNSLIRMIESMDEPTRDEFAKLMESEASEEELEKFLAERVPGADKAIEEAVESLTDDILAVSEPD